MPLTPEQKTQISKADRDRTTRALQLLTGAKGSGSLADNLDIRELEAALQTRLAQLNSLDDSQRVSEIVDGAIAIINEQGRSDLGASIKTDS